MYCALSPSSLCCSRLQWWNWESTRTMLTRSVTDQVTIYLNCSKVWGTFERASVYHRITSELSAIFALDPTQEMCEECVSQKGRKEERRISSTCGSRTHNLLLTGLSLCYGRATDGSPRKWALIQCRSAPKQARSWWLSLGYHSLLYLVESCRAHLIYHCLVTSYMWHWHEIIRFC